MNLFLFLNDSINAIVILQCLHVICKSNLEFLSKIISVYVDNMFKYCINFFFFAEKDINEDKLQDKVFFS